MLACKFGYFELVNAVICPDEMRTCLIKDTENTPCE